MRVIGWLTLLICMWTAGDLVIDLVFEEPDVAVDIHATSEEPDNAAEHLLIPSQRGGSSTADAIAAILAADFDACFITLTMTDHAVLRAATSHHRPPRSSPVSCSTPLRI